MDSTNNSINGLIVGVVVALMLTAILGGLFFFISCCCAFAEDNVEKLKRKFAPTPVNKKDNQVYIISVHDVKPPKS